MSEMRDNGAILSVIVLFFGFIIAIGGIGFRYGYQAGQLEYQKSIVKYELTDTGYKEIITNE